MMWSPWTLLQTRASVPALARAVTVRAAPEGPRGCAADVRLQRIHRRPYNPLGVPTRYLVTLTVLLFSLPPGAMLCAAEPATRPAPAGMVWIPGGEFTMGTD